MSWVVEITHVPIAPAPDEAWEELEHLREEEEAHEYGAPPSAPLRRLYERLTERFPCITEDSNSPWSDGPLINNFGDKLAAIGIAGSRIGEALPFVIETATEMGFTVFDAGHEQIHRDLRCLVSRAVAVAFVALIALACERQSASPVTTGPPSQPASSRRQADVLVSRTLAIPGIWRTETSELPISYLERLEVDPGWQLSRTQRDELAQLIAAAHRTSIAEYKQDYLLSTRSLLWQLITRNYRGADRLVHDGGVFLGQLTEYLIGYDEGGT